MVNSVMHGRPVNRREFVSITATGAAVLALAGSQSEASDPGPTGAGPNKRVGISDQTFRRAQARAAALVNRMTLEEKISQLNNGAPAIKRLGVSRYQYWSEALHGLNHSAPVTSFPLPLAMACSWNPKLALDAYNAVSDEARSYHNKENSPLSFYSPQTLNLHRDPRWGRCEEAPGEDPCLAATWAAHVIRGMQGDNPNYLKTTACAKHFICNNTDDDRTGVSASVSSRNFWEYYTRAYRAAVIDGGVFTVMGAYNAINGVPCCADHFLLTDLLRRRWGFRGYVTSDCDAVANICNPHHYVPTLHQAAALAIQAGCDLNCGDTMAKHLAKAVADELVSEADISRAVTRLFTARVLFGEFDPPQQIPYSRIYFSAVNSLAHQALALDAARQSIVLLKNQDHVLPLPKTKFKSVAVIGPTARFHLGGYSGDPSVRISPLDGLAAALGVRVQYPWIRAEDAVRVSHGVKTENCSEGGIDFCWNTNGSWEEFPPQDFSGKTKIVIRAATANSGGAVEAHLDSLTGPIAATIKIGATHGWQNWKNFAAPLNGITGRHKVYLRCLGGGGSIFNIQWFQLLPLPSIPPRQPGGLQLIYRPGCSIAGPKDEKTFTEAVDAARRADLVIMVCGVNQSVDGEGHDRKDIRLTGVQHDLIKACYQANPKTLLVISSNNTVAVNWEQENLPAIVSALFAGQAQGTAIADVLFGHYNPGGKTCCTWYKSVAQLPPFHNYDIMKGRTYMYFEGDPLYPFGYGLSYTTFRISDMHIDAKVLSAKKSAKISCTVKNTGQRAGAEVVQFYVTAPQSPVKRPIKELVGFQRVELQPGESKTVTFTLPYNAQALWYWHESQRQCVLQPGTLKLMIGSSSADIHLTGNLDLQACTDTTLGGPETLDTLAVPVVVS